MKKVLLAVVIFCVCVFSSEKTQAQTIEQAMVSYQQFTNLRTSGANSALMYDALYQSYRDFVAVLDNSQPGSTDYSQAKILLIEFLPLLQNGAAYYSNNKSMNKAVLFAQAFVDLAHHPAFQNDGLTRDQFYPSMTYFAASVYYNSKDYRNAIRYLRLYLESGDGKNRQKVYNYLARAYTYVGDTNSAMAVLYEGYRDYPRDFDMLSVAINNCIEINDIDNLQFFLSKALAVKPDDKTLLNIQGQLYEEMYEYQKALNIYSIMLISSPNSLTITEHVALNNYNLGVINYSQAKMESDGGKAQFYMQSSKDYFAASAELFEQIIYNKPGSVKYTQALALAYCCLGNETKLREVNAKLSALGSPYVSPNAAPPLIAYSDKSVDLSVTGSNTYIAQNKSNVESSYNKSDLSYNSSAEAPVTRPAAKSRPATEPASRESQAGTSDVDMDIPVIESVNTKTFAVVICNENYSMVSPVPMALNDGEVFGQYCQKTLGLPENNVRLYKDATFGVMMRAMRDIKGIAEAFEGDIQVIFYYAGHGVPDESTKDAFLLPIDADGMQTEGCYSLNRLYSELGGLGARSVFVFLDACFSGASREGSMLASARGVALKPKKEDPKGNMVIFSAASDDETAMPYKEKGHGLFTYFLLKKLKESKGDVTLQELGDYIITNVKQQSLVVNRKKQTPSVVPSESMATGWTEIRLNGN